MGRGEAPHRGDQALSAEARLGAEGAVFEKRCVELSAGDGDGDGRMENPHK